MKKARGEAIPPEVGAVIMRSLRLMTEKLEAPASKSAHGKNPIPKLKKGQYPVKNWEPDWRAWVKELGDSPCHTYLRIKMGMPVIDSSGKIRQLLTKEKAEQMSSFYSDVEDGMVELAKQRMITSWKKAKAQSKAWGTPELNKLRWAYCQKRINEMLEDPLYSRRTHAVLASMVGEEVDRTGWTVLKHVKFK